MTLFNNNILKSIQKFLKTNFDENIRSTVRAIIIDKNLLVLLVKRVVISTQHKKTIYFTFPGGGFEKEKDNIFIDTLYREIKEELDIDINKDCQILYENPLIIQNHIFVIMYYLKGNLKTIKQNIHSEFSNISKSTSMAKGLSSLKCIYIKLLPNIKVFPIESIKYIQTHLSKIKVIINKQNIKNSKIL